MGKIRCKSLLLLAVMVSSFGGWYVFAGMFSDVLQNNGLMTDESFNDVPGKASVTDIYKQTLKQVKAQELKPVSKSITTTRNVLNKKYGCSLNDDDLINIMYVNGKLKGTILEQITLEQATLDGQDFVAPINSDMEKSCQKLIYCKNKVGSPSKIQIGPTLAGICADEVTRLYSISNTVNASRETFTSDNFGMDLLKNGNADDSDFDLMIDVQNIGKLMFEGFKPPVEVLYYKLPELVNPPSDNGSSDNNSATTEGTLYAGNSYGDQIPQALINLVCQPGYFFSSDKSQCCQVNNTEYVCVQPTCKEPFSFRNGKCVSAQEATRIDSIFVDTAGGSDIQDLVNSTKETVPGATNYGSILPGNNCITPDAYTAEQELLTTTTEASVYNPQKICDAGFQMSEGKCCPIGNTDVNACIEPSCTNQGTYHKATGKCISAYDLDGDGSVSPTEEASQVEYYGNTLGDKISDLTAPVKYGDCNQECAGGGLESVGKSPDSLGCETKCCAVKCKDLPLSQKVLCNAQCLCTTITSPTFDKKNHPELDSLYKIQMCMIAPADSQISRGKTVYSIEETINEIKNILYGLKDSGKTNQTVKTKELLDSSTKKMKFGEIFSFSLIFKKKPLFDTVKDSQKAKKAVAENIDLKTLYQMPNRNKYVMLGDHASIQALTDTFLDSTDYASKVTELRKEMSSYLEPVVNPATISVQQLENFATMNDEVISFLANNVKFRTETQKTFTEILDISRTMNDKISKAK